MGCGNYRGICLLGLVGLSFFIPQSGMKNPLQTGNCGRCGATVPVAMPRQRHKTHLFYPVIASPDLSGRSDPLRASTGLSVGRLQHIPKRRLKPSHTIVVVCANVHVSLMREMRLQKFGRLRGPPFEGNSGGGKEPTAGGSYSRSGGIAPKGPLCGGRMTLKDPPRPSAGCRVFSRR
jgi:hypothetical protein